LAGFPAGPQFRFIADYRWIKWICNYKIIEEDKKMKQRTRVDEEGRHMEKT
jgi:hypothetical protein